MAINRFNTMKQARRVGVDLDFKTRSNKSRHMAPPGKPEGARISKTPYSEQLRMKQLIRFYYGVTEKQFRNYYKLAERKSGPTGYNLLVLLDSRLDNVVYKMGFAVTRSEAKQLVSHGHIRVNGKYVNISSYRLSPGDEVKIADKSKKHLRIVTALQSAGSKLEQTYLDVNVNDMSGVYKDFPESGDFPEMFKVNLVVELYSKC